MQDEGKLTPFVQGPYSQWRAEFSPNGKWIAYQSDESGQYEVLVRAFPGPGPERQVSTDGGVRPVWSPDEQELFYFNRGTIMAVKVDFEPEFQAGKPAPLFEEQGIVDYDIAPDGNRFIMVTEDRSHTRHTASCLNAVLNAFDELG